MAGFPFAEYFGEINTLAELQFMPGEKGYIDRPSVAPEPKDLLLYLGCNVLRTAHLAKTVIDVLRAMSFDFNAAGGPAHCCGIIHHQNKEPAGGRTIAANSMRHFARYGAKKVLMWCPPCNEFPQSDLDWANTRVILAAIPGLDLVQIASTDAFGRHCSPKWINRIGRPQWQKEMSRVLDAARDAKVDIVATLYHSCHREICEAEAQYPFEIVNYISLLGEAMGIEHPDVYKRFKLKADPDAVYDEVEVYIRANGLDAARVRALLRKTFAPSCDIDASNPS